MKHVALTPTTAAKVRELLRAAGDAPFAATIREHLYSSAGDPGCEVKLVKCGASLGGGTYEATVYLVDESGTWQAMTGSAVLEEVNGGSLEEDDFYPALRCEVVDGVPVYRTYAYTLPVPVSVEDGGTGLSTHPTAGQILMGDGSGGYYLTSLPSSSGGATSGVTSVGLTAPSWLTVGGSPVTSSGVLSLTASTGQPAYQCLATTGGAVALRSLVAADVPNLDTSKLTTGQLANARGGTGLDTSGATNGQLLIGNGSGFNLAHLTAGANVTITNGAGTITIAATTGTATSGGISSVGLVSSPNWLTVTGSPVVAPSGSFTLSAATQSANYVLAGPTSGGAVAPAFRALVSDDVPALDAGKIATGQLATARGGTGLDGSAAGNGKLLIGNGSGFSLNNLTASTGIVITNSAGGITIATTGLGTLSSVGLTSPNFMSVSNTPVTGSGGTLGLSANSQSANLVLAGPTSGSAATPDFRALVAADVPALDASKITTGTFSGSLIPYGAFRVLVSELATTTVANTVTETTLLSSAYTFTSANLAAATTIRCVCGGIVSTNGTGQQVTIKFKMGTVVIGMLLCAFGGTSGTNMPWEASFTLTIRTTGAPGTAGACGSGHVATITFPDTVSTCSPTTSSNPALDITATWTNANANNTISLTCAHVTQIG